MKFDKISTVTLHKIQPCFDFGSDVYSILAFIPINFVLLQRRYLQLHSDHLVLCGFLCVRQVVIAYNYLDKI